MIDAVAADAAGQKFLKVRVRAVAEKGKANDAVVRLVAGAIGLPRSVVSIEAGETARLKTLRIAGAPEDVAQRLLRLTGEAHDG